MGVEIERKYLVVSDFKADATDSYVIKQGYLSSHPWRSVRVRISADLAFLTVKGASDANGLSRYEWEKEIDIQEAEALLKLCEPGIIHKTRYLIPEKGGLQFEVDVFEGQNKGLVIAEIELPTEHHVFNKPSWLGEEVSGDEKYYNASLSQFPYEKWK